MLWLFLGIFSFLKKKLKGSITCIVWIMNIFFSINYFSHFFKSHYSSFTLHMLCPLLYYVLLQFQILARFRFSLSFSLSFSIYLLYLSTYANHVRVDGIFALSIMSWWSTLSLERCLHPKYYPAYFALSFSFLSLYLLLFLLYIYIYLICGAMCFFQLLCSPVFPLETKAKRRARGSKRWSIELMYFRRTREEGTGWEDEELDRLSFCVFDLSIAICRLFRLTFHYWALIYYPCS